MELFNLNYIIDYGGPGFIWILWIASMIYLFLTEKKKHIRLIVVWASLVSLVLFILPLSKWLYVKVLDAPTYYRLLWTIPVGLIIAFAGTKTFLKHRLIGLILCSFVIVLTGQKIYRSQHFSISENEYQIPDQVIELCDAIHPEYYEVKACFPVEYIHQVLQYDSMVRLAYGREVLVPGWSGSNPFYEAEKEDVLDVSKITTLCFENEIEYYIVRKDKKRSESFDAYEWTLFYESKDYEIWKEQNVKSTWEKVKEWLATDENMTEEEKNHWLDSQGISRDYQR